MTARAIGLDGRRRAASSIALRESELAVLMFVGDVLVAGGAAIAAPSVLAAFDSKFAPHVDLRIYELVLVAAWVVLLYVFGGADLPSPRFARRTLTAVARAALASGALILVMFFFVPFFAPRGSTLVTVLLIAITTLVWRYAFLRALGTWSLERRVAVVGMDDAARRAAAAVRRWQGAMRYEVVAFLVPGGEADGDVAGAPLVALTDDPWTTIGQLGVDLLVVGHTRNVPSALLAELTRCFEHGVAAVPATMLYEQLTGRVLASALEADWYAELPTYSRGIYMAAKRGLDIAVALVAGTLALILTPLIMLAIALDSRGPVLHRQVRVGLRGQTFVVHKFRTMRVDAESDGRARWSMPHDARITRVGRILRRTHIDELPQLWDVLRGKMSLIGPRPERPEFAEQLARELPLYRARTLVRPGITGWAQVQYPYAASIESNVAKLEYDLYYIRHIGPALDIAVALRTLFVMLSPKDLGPQLD